MSHQFTTEIGRLRTQDAIGRAERYRLTHKVRGQESRSTRSRGFAFGRALAAMTLSCLMGICLAAVALASPMGPGAHGDGVTAAVKADNPGQPVRSEHAYSAGRTRDEFISRWAATQRHHPAVASGRSDNWSVTTIADARALNEPSTSDTPIHVIAQLRALNEPVSSAKIDAIAQLRAMNEPFSTTNVSGPQASEYPETNFPLLQSVAIIMGILVLIAAALVVVGRNQQSPRTV
jgi:hypothetical protein